MKRKIVLLVGSKHDFGQIREGVNALRIAKKQGLIEWEIADVCSAHRNPERLPEILDEYVYSGVDAIIAVAGKFAALFGIVDAYLRNVRKKDAIRVIPVPLKGKTQQASLAALYGVLEVPNHKLIFKEEFFHDPIMAFEHAISGELPKAELEIQKLPERLTPEEVYELTRIKHPPKAAYDETIQSLEEYGFYHMYTGKTRETFIHPNFPGLLYIFATDRISIFDIVLNARVETKGVVLNAMTVHWLTQVFSDVPNHLIAYGHGIEDYLPKEMIPGAFYDYLASRMLIVKKTKVLKVEAIVRGFLTGSGLKDYKKTGSVCGIPLPVGLVDGSELPEPIFTPSTKADYGLHDENIPFEKACEIIGEDNAVAIRQMSLHLYTKARDIARKVGIIIADTKFEFGIDENGEIFLIDEVLTPDSSRFWPEEKRLSAMAKGKTPPSLDKQPVRDAGELVGVKKDSSWIPPQTLLDETSEKYWEVLQLFTGKLPTT
jgi:phosphoribosylaminoimidazole-succinocarboxamide synthase